MIYITNALHERFKVRDNLPLIATMVTVDDVRLHIASNRLYSVAWDTSYTAVQQCCNALKISPNTAGGIGLHVPTDAHPIICLRGDTIYYPLKYVQGSGRIDGGEKVSFISYPNFRFFQKLSFMHQW